jgi:hypothetical protein
MSIKVRTPDGAEFLCNFLPDTCPLCHYAMEPRPLTAVDTGPIIQTAYRVFLDVAFKCVRRECGHIFISRYIRILPTDPYEYSHSVPVTFEPPPIPEEIEQLSPNFVEIYGQAAAAEQYLLNQMAGVGYRKALEFLVKDYCISQHPDKAEEIKGAWLATCIKNYVGDVNTKLCAERAAWLGNDETHYVRRWEDKDIGDLKTLIKLTMAWIQNNLLTAKYFSDMK